MLMHLISWTLMTRTSDNAREVKRLWQLINARVPESATWKTAYRFESGKFKGHEEGGCILV